MKEHPFPFLMQRVFGSEIEHLHETEEESSRCETCVKKKRNTEKREERRVKDILKRHPEIM